MMSRQQRRSTRICALALMASVVLVFCQIAAVVHATSFAVADIARDQTAADMARMVGCDGLPDTDGNGSSDCPSEHATCDSGKLPMVAPLPAALAFSPASSHQTGLAGAHRYDWPQGRAPPRSRLCSWVI